ncbi:aminoglycoside phosphotransferase family protein [Phaeovulum sp.]|uniref:aminoglycoside phosphotransferase family protein n=1 Tax=Phaeovulum sp. TaxID=2934796 RepID=UPI0039E2F8A3
MLEPARDAEIVFFLNAAGWGQATRRPLAGDASARRYERLTATHGSAVLMDAPPASGEDVTRFTRMARWLHERGFSAPEILAENVPNGLLLLEDLGDDLLARLIATDPSREPALYNEVTQFLLALHRHPAPDFVLPLDGPALADLTRLTPEWYLPGIGARASAASAEIPALIKEAYARLNREDPVLSLRDFHAENLLWLPGRAGVARLGLLDFQDAVAAHPAYDLVSALQDARRDVSPTVEAAERAHYAAAKGLDQGRFSAIYALLGAQRSLRILGVFARLCMAAGKPHYVDLIPRTWAYIGRNLAHPELAGLAAAVYAALPAPTPERLERIKDQCGQYPMR